MVTFWDSWARNLTAVEVREIERVSHGFAWFNFNKYSGKYDGGFYYFPKNSGYIDSPPIPIDIKPKVELRTLEMGWIKEEDKSFTPLETVAQMFPEEMDRLYERLEAKISKEHVK